MPWDNIEIKFPEDIIPSLLVDGKRCLINAPNIEISPFSGRERGRHNKRKLPITDAELLQAMHTHTYWLSEHFRDCVVNKESGYGAPRVRAVTNLGFMLGLRSHYFQTGEDVSVHDSDNEMEEFDPEMVSVVSDAFRNHMPLKENPEIPENDDNNEQLKKRVRDRGELHGLELSDDGLDSVDGSSDDDSDGHNNNKKRRSQSQDETASSEKAGDRKVKQEGPSPFSSFSNRTASDMERSLFYDYYQNSKVKTVDVVDIDDKLLNDVKYTSSRSCSVSADVNKKMDKGLLSIIDKGDVVGFSKIVASMKCPPVKLTSELLHDIAIWKSWLINGQHLCFYGEGSKRQTLKAFMDVALRDGTVVMIDAYRVKGSSCEDMWQMLRGEFVRRKSASSVGDYKQETVKAVDDMRKPFYILVFGLELLVSRGAFNSLMPLIKLGNVRLIGSMDHLRSSLSIALLDQGLRNYRLICINTGVDYRKEVLAAWENNPPMYIMNTDKQKSPQELHAILSALSANHRRLFSLIAQLQLEANASTKSGSGIEKYSLLKDRRAVTVCNNESKLDALLTEFITHNLVNQHRGAGGRLYLFIPIPPKEHLDIYDKGAVTLFWQCKVAR